MHALLEVHETPLSRGALVLGSTVGVSVQLVPSQCSASVRRGRVVNVS